MLFFLRRTAASVLASFWFLPAVMVMVAAIAAIGSVALDRALLPDEARHLGWAWSGGADGARSVMSTVARSQMTVVSVVFSITIATMAQASSHYGSRVLRNFTADRGVQITLGVFLATFVYCLLVLRTIRSVEESAFVPSVSINIGITLALASLAVLIYFIHHVSQMIQAEPLIAGIGRDLVRRLSGDLPDTLPPLCKPGVDLIMPGPLDPAVTAAGSGYLQQVHYRRLLDIASRHEALVWLEKRPGDFVSIGETLLRIRGGSLSPTVMQELRQCLAVGTHHLPDQDPRYALQQLVEIAVRAGGEPFTTLTCLDWLGNALRHVLQSPPSGTLYADAAGAPRLILPVLGFAELADMGFTQIRIGNADNAGVLLGMLDTLAVLAGSLQRAQDGDVLLHQARLVGDCAERLPLAVERQQVATRLRSAVARLEACRDPVTCGG